MDRKDGTLQARTLFTSGELAALLGATVDDVDYWVRSGIIKPSVRASAGHGSRRLFGWDDLRRALLVQRLRSARWRPKQIVRALGAVEQALKNPEALHVPVLVHEGNCLLILCRDRARELLIMDASSPGQYVMVIALDTLEEETRRSLARCK